MLRYEDLSPHTLIIVGEEPALVDALTKPNTYGLKSMLRLAPEPVASLADVQHMQMTGTCVVLMRVDRDSLDEAYVASLADEVRKLRFLKHDASLVFIAFGDDLSDEDVVILSSRADMDLVLQAAAAPVLAATALSLARLTEMFSKGRRQNFERDGIAALRIGQWAIDISTKIARLPDGSDVRLTQAELDYLRFLAIPGSAEDALLGDLAPRKGVRKSALVYKIRSKLGQDFPIVNTGPETYRIG